MSASPLQRVAREDLSVFWSLRSQGSDGKVQLRGSIHRNTSRLSETPSLTSEITFLKSTIGDVTMETVLALAEDRLSVDLMEVNREGPFADAPVTEEINMMRLALGLPALALPHEEADHDDHP